MPHTVAHFFMGLFGNNQSTDDASSSMANQSGTVQDQVNVVGEGTVFEGTIRAESDVRASGHIIGTLEVKGKTMIAKEGSVEGEVMASLWRRGPSSRANAKWGRRSLPTAIRAGHSKTQRKRRPRRRRNNHPRGFGIM